jgi:hypothetical protein
MKKKSRIPFYWLVGAAVILGTNNIVSFIQNIKTGDLSVMAVAVVLLVLSLRDVRITELLK